MKSPLKVAGYVHPPLELHLAKSVVPQQIALVREYCRQRGFDHVLTVVETAYIGQRQYVRFAELVKASCRFERPYDLLVTPWWSHVPLAGHAFEQMDAKLLSAGVYLIAINDRYQPKHDLVVGGNKR